MRKKLLSLVAMAFVAIGICAQTWTAPELPEPATIASDPVSGHAYRIKHVKASEYFSEVLSEELGTEENVDACIAGGQIWFSWSTTAKLSYDEYEMIAFTMTQDTEGTWTMKGYDGNWPGKFLFISGNNIDGFAMHVDGANPTNFEVIKQENGYYHIRAAANDATYGQEKVEDWANKCMTWRKDEAQPYAIYGALVPDIENEVYGDWEFLDMNLHIYDAQLQLYNLAATIETEDLGVDYEQFTEAYESSDFAALTEALEQLSRLVGVARVEKYLTHGADGVNEPSDDNPADGRPLIVNNNFDSGDIDDWTCTFKKDVNATNIGYQSNKNYVNGDVTVSKFIEAWANAVFNPNVDYRSLGDGELSQRRYNLPQGKYQFTCDAIARQQDGKSVPCTGVQLFAIGGEADTFQEIATGDGVPEHFELTFASTGGDVVLGLRTINATANWMAADNFTLTYYGKTTLDPAKIALDGIISKHEEQYGEDASEVRANKEIKEAYAAAFTDAKNATSDYATYGDNLNAAGTDLKNSISDYARLDEFIQKAQNDADDYEGFQIGGDIADLLDEYLPAYEEETATSEDIETWIGAYDVTLLEGVKAALAEASAEKPLKISILGTNLDYANNAKEPWVTTLFTSLGGDGYKVNYHNGEVWQNSFSCLQTISDLPAGQYTIKAKAFYRDGDNGPTYEAYQLGEFVSTTYLVANANKQAVPCLAAAAELGETAPEGSAYTETAEGSGIWMPNSQQSAEWAFINHAEDLTCEVNTYLANDGDLTFGTRNDDIVEAANQWSVWTGFEIFYTGKSVNALYDQVQTLMDEASNLKVEKNKGADQKIQDALNAGDEVTPESSEAILTATANQLIEAIEYARNYVALENKLRETAQTYYDLLYTTAPQAEINGSDTSLETLLGEVQAILDDDSGELTYNSNEEIEEWIASMPAKWFAYVLSQDGFEAASEENALDVTTLIINPDFEAPGSTREQQAPYWTTDLMGKNNGFQNNNTYSNADGTITLSNFIECWIPSGTLTDGRIYQTLAAALPAGFYCLEVDGQSNGSEGVYLMADNGDNIWTKLITTDTPSHHKIVFESDGINIFTIGILVQETSAGWIAFDNFQLKYIGQTAPVAVENITAATENKAVVIYNLAGQRVQKAVRGLYIINGKKVLVK